MFDRLKNLFAEPKTEAAPEEAERQTRLAACVLLLEAASADQDGASVEMDQVTVTLQRRYGGSEESLEELIGLAQAEREKAVDLWQFTNHLNQHLSETERLGVMTDVWQVIQADDRLEGHEDHFAHKLGHLLRLTHQQLIEAKLEARKNSA